MVPTPPVVAHAPGWRPGSRARSDLQSKSLLAMGLEAQGELRVLAHPVRRPRRREHHRGVDGLDAVELADELLDLLGDLRPDRAARRGQAEGDVHLAPVDLDAVDEPELDEIQPQLGVDDVGERRLDVFNCDHVSMVRGAGLARSYN